MKIWVDADACPGAVKDIVLRASERVSVPAVFVANKPLYLPPSPLTSFIQVQKGPDVVDAYIVAEAEAGDLVITQDIPLAAELVPKGVSVMSPRGALFTPDNIRERLSVRDFLQDLRDTGTTTGGPSPFGEKEKRQFANQFDQELTRLLRSRP